MLPPYQLDLAQLYLDTEAYQDCFDTLKRYTRYTDKKEDTRYSAILAQLKTMWRYNGKLISTLEHL
jgi:hypothetical protein